MHKNQIKWSKIGFYVETTRTILVQKWNLVIRICFLFVLTNQLIVTFRIDDLDVFCMNPCDGVKKRKRTRKRQQTMAFE